MPFPDRGRCGLGAVLRADGVVGLSCGETNGAFCPIGSTGHEIYCATVKIPDKSRQARSRHDRKNTGMRAATLVRDSRPTVSTTCPCAALRVCTSMWSTWYVPAQPHGGERAAGQRAGQAAAPIRHSRFSLDPSVHHLNSGCQNSGLRQKANLDIGAWQIAVARVLSFTTP